MNRALGLLAVAVLVSCGTSAPPPVAQCSAETCGGCCDGTRCEAGRDVLQCGSGGAACERCSDGLTCTGRCEVVSSDAGTVDAGAPDAGQPDAGDVDAGPIDAGQPDAGVIDSGITGFIPVGGFLVDGGLALRVFTSAATLTGDFKTYTGQSDGIAGGDVFCQTFADFQGLGGTWNALLANGSVNAFERFNDRGPWVLLGTNTVAFGFDGITGPNAVPLNITELGTTVNDSVWTGARRNGDGTNEHCQNWSSADTADRAIVSESNAVGAGWVSGLTQNCSTLRHLYCLERDRPDGGLVQTGPVKRVFVSSQTYRGDLLSNSDAGSGVAAGDARCQGLADAQHLGGRWLAYLSTPSIRAGDRFTHPGPWALLVNDGGVVFSTRARLAFDRPRMPINVDELGVVHAGGAAWTGTDFGGGPTTDTLDCYRWALAGSTTDGTIGDIASMTRWRTNMTLSCQSSASLYCFEQ